MLNIKDRLDDYLEFDSNQLFEKGLLTRIFGGAIRDSIAGQKINDIDLLTGAKSMIFVRQILLNNGFNFIESLQSKDLARMYSDIHVICEPHTWIKGEKMIQVIRPRSGYKVPSKEEYEKDFNNLISNVDLSCCGVSWNGRLQEDYPNSIIHCQNKVFSVNENAKMYSNSRINHRIYKMQNRGWEQIPNDITNNREQKINNILNYDINLDI
jgi:hypothetical protein